MFQLLEDLYLYFITKGPSYLVIAHNIKSEVLLLDYIEQVLLQVVPYITLPIS